MQLWKGLMIEAMPQRTTASQVAPVFREFARRHPTLASLRELDMAGGFRFVEAAGTGVAHDVVC